MDDIGKYQSTLQYSSLLGDSGGLRWKFGMVFPSGIQINLVICEAIIITYAQSHDTEQIYEANLFFSKLWCNQSLEA